MIRIAKKLALIFVTVLACHFIIYLGKIICTIIFYIGLIVIGTKIYKGLNNVIRIIGDKINHEN